MRDAPDGRDMQRLFKPIKPPQMTACDRLSAQSWYSPNAPRPASGGGMA
jgi:hypothetical protein